MVNEIYDGLETELFKKEMGKNYDAKKLKHYQSMTNKLMSSLIQGFKNRETTHVGKMIIQECPNCGSIVRGGKDVCPKCGRRIMVGSPQGWR